MSAPLIYIDVVEVEPLTFDEWNNRYRGHDDPQTRYRDYRDRFQPFYWVSRSGDNQKKLGKSTERYFNEPDCRHAIDLQFGARSNVYLRRAEMGNRALRLANWVTVPE